MSVTGPIPKGAQRALGEPMDTPVEMTVQDGAVHPYTAVTDAELMTMAASDDQMAYRMLVERHFKRVYALAYRMIYHGVDAEDIAQETFLKLWIKRHNWRQDGAAVSTWLYRVTVNAAIDYKRRPRTSPLGDASDPIDQQPTAVTLIHKQEVNVTLRKAMMKLSEQQHAALVLFYQQDLSNIEAAKILDISVNAMESLLKRARAKLREVLKHSSDEMIAAIRDE